MAQDTSLNGLRSQYLTQIHGRRLALDPGDYLVGPKELRLQVEGWNAAGSTITSTAVATALSPWGVSIVGASAASGTTAYTLSAPVPGVAKYIFCPTTGYAVITSSGAGGFIVSTGSVTSTIGTVTFAGKGGMLHLLGLTTALYACMTPISTISTQITLG